jgi:hypothetical protein
VAGRRCRVGRRRLYGRCRTGRIGKGAVSIGMGLRRPTVVNRRVQGKIGHVGGAVFIWLPASVTAQTTSISPKVWIRAALGHSRRPSKGQNDQEYSPNQLSANHGSFLRWSRLRRLPIFNTSQNRQKNNRAPGAKSGGPGRLSLGRSDTQRPPLPPGEGRGEGIYGNTAQRERTSPRHRAKMVVSRRERGRSTGGKSQSAGSRSSGSGAGAFGAAAEALEAGVFPGGCGSNWGNGYGLSAPATLGTLNTTWPISSRETSDSQPPSQRHATARHNIAALHRTCVASGATVRVQSIVSILSGPGPARKGPTM